jgi:hypothetical protein
MMGFRVWVWSTSIRMPRGSVCEGVCIAVGVAVEGGACEQRKENRVYRGVECVIGGSAE